MAEAACLGCLFTSLESDWMCDKERCPHQWLETRFTSDGEAQALTFLLELRNQKKYWHPRRTMLLMTPNAVC